MVKYSHVILPQGCTSAIWALSVIGIVLSPVVEISLPIRTAAVRTLIIFGSYQVQRYLDRLDALEPHTVRATSLEFDAMQSALLHLPPSIDRSALRRMTAWILAACTFRLNTLSRYLALASTELTREEASVIRTVVILLKACPLANNREFRGYVAAEITNAATDLSVIVSDKIRILDGLTR